MTCLFCRIAAKEIAAEIIDEDEETVAVLDVRPLAIGHSLVLPKVHAANILALPDDKVGAVFRAVKRLTAKLERAFKPDGFTIGINHGRVSGQAVDHLHIHIIPRFEGDGGKSLHAVVDNPPRQSLKEIRDKILEA